MEMEAANNFFELMKKRHTFNYFRVWFIFGQIDLPVDFNCNIVTQVDPTTVYFKGD